MLNVLRKNSLKYGLVGAYTLILKSSLEKNYVTGHVTTSSKIYTRKVVIKIVLMFGSSFIILGHPSKSEYSGLFITEVKEVNKRRRTMPFVKSYMAR